MASALVVIITWQVFRWSLSYGEYFVGHYHMVSVSVVTDIWRVLPWSLSHGQCFGGHCHMVGLGGSLY